MQTKHCFQCDTMKPVSEYNRRGERWQSRCRACQKIWYEEHKEQHLRNSTRNRKRQTEAARQYIVMYLRQHPCVDCGESDAVVLEFDHVRGKKLCSVTAMYRRGFSLSKIKEEIAKCEVRCANCHRRVTAKRAGNWRRSLLT